MRWDCLRIIDAIDDRMAVSGVKWLHQQGCHVMPDNKASARCLLKNGFEYLLTKEEDWGYGQLNLADMYSFDCC